MCRVKDVVKYVDDNNIFVGDLICSIDQVVNKDNSIEVGVSERFVMADNNRPYLYTRDINSCIVILIECVDKAWMIHLDFDDINAEKYFSYIVSFYNNTIDTVRNVFVFPGMNAEISYLRRLVNIFNKYHNILKYPYYDSNLGFSKGIGSIFYKFSSDSSFLGIDRDGFLCQYNIDFLCINKSDSFFKGSSPTKNKHLYDFLLTKLV